MRRFASSSHLVVCAILLGHSQQCWKRCCSTPHSEGKSHRSESVSATTASSSSTSGTSSSSTASSGHAVEEGPVSTSHSSRDQLLQSLRNLKPAAAVASQSKPITRSTVHTRLDDHNAAKSADKSNRDTHHGSSSQNQVDHGASPSRQPPASYSPTHSYDRHHRPHQHRQQTQHSGTRRGTPHHRHQAVVEVHAESLQSFLSEVLTKYVPQLKVEVVAPLTDSTAAATTEQPASTTAARSDWQRIAATLHSLSEALEQVESVSSTSSSVSAASDAILQRLVQLGSSSEQNSGSNAFPSSLWSLFSSSNELLLHHQYVEHIAHEILKPATALSLLASFGTLRRLARVPPHSTSQVRSSNAPNSHSSEEKDQIENGGARPSAASAPRPCWAEPMEHLSIVLHQVVAVWTVASNLSDAGWAARHGAQVLRHARRVVINLRKCQQTLQLTAEHRVTAAYTIALALRTLGSESKAVLKRDDSDTKLMALLKELLQYLLPRLPTPVLRTIPPNLWPLGSPADAKARDDAAYFDYLAHSVAHRTVHSTLNIRSQLIAELVEAVEEAEQQQGRMTVKGEAFFGCWMVPPRLSNTSERYPTSMVSPELKEGQAKDAAASSLVSRHVEIFPLPPRRPHACGVARSYVAATGPIFLLPRRAIASLTASLTFVLGATAAPRAHRSQMAPLTATFFAQYALDLEVELATMTDVHQRHGWRLAPLALRHRFRDRGLESFTFCLRSLSTDDIQALQALPYRPDEPLVRLDWHCRVSLANLRRSIAAYLLECIVLSAANRTLYRSASQQQPQPPLQYEQQSVVKAVNIVSTTFFPLLRRHYLETGDVLLPALKVFETLQRVFDYCALSSSSSSGRSQGQEGSEEAPTKRYFDKKVRGLPVGVALEVVFFASRALTDAGAGEELKQVFQRLVEGLMESLVRNSTFYQHQSKRLLKAQAKSASDAAQRPQHEEGALAMEDRLGEADDEAGLNNDPHTGTVLLTDSVGTALSSSSLPSSTEFHLMSEVLIPLRYDSTPLLLLHHFQFRTPSLPLMTLQQVQELLATMAVFGSNVHQTQRTDGEEEERREEEEGGTDHHETKESSSHHHHPRDSFLSSTAVAPSSSSPVESAFRLLLSQRVSRIYSQASRGYLSVATRRDGSTMSALLQKASNRTEPPAATDDDVGSSTSAMIRSLRSYSSSMLQRAGPAFQVATFDPERMAPVHRTTVTAWRILAPSSEGISLVAGAGTGEQGDAADDFAVMVVAARVHEVISLAKMLGFRERSVNVEPTTGAAATGTPASTTPTTASQTKTTIAGDTNNNKGGANAADRSLPPQQPEAVAAAAAPPPSSSSNVIVLSIPVQFIAAPPSPPVTKKKKNASEDDEESSTERKKKTLKKGSKKKKSKPSSEKEPILLMETEAHSADGEERNAAHGKLQMEPLGFSTSDQRTITSVTRGQAFQRALKKLGYFPSDVVGARITRIGATRFVEHNDDDGAAATSTDMKPFMAALHEEIARAEADAVSVEKSPQQDEGSPTQQLVKKVGSVEIEVRLF